MDDPVRSERPSQFYTGLVADLYDPLVSERARAEDYVPFLERSGTPALELACGTGRPMLDLVDRGFAVEGLDASADMLERCRAAAAERGLEVTLHRGEMQSFSLGRRYRSIFLAGPSFVLLTSDADAARTLARIHAHLEPGGTALIPLEIPDAAALRPFVGRAREAETGDGGRVRVSMLDVRASADGRDLTRRLRYERESADGTIEQLERDWRTRSWSPAAFRALLEAAGFERIRITSIDGGPVAADAPLFVARASRPRQD